MDELNTKHRLFSEKQRPEQVKSLAQDLNPNTVTDQELEIITGGSSEKEKGAKKGAWRGALIGAGGGAFLGAGLSRGKSVKGMAIATAVGGAMGGGTGAGIGAGVGAATSKNPRIAPRGDQ